MADFSDTIVIVEGVDTDVIGTSDPNLQAGAVKESGQVGFFIVSEIPYSIYFKNSVGLWSGTPAVAFTSGTLQKTFAFEWGTNTAFYIKTATSGHKMFAKPSSSNIVVDSDLTDGDFTRTKIVIGNQVSTILGDVTGGTVAVLESVDESLQTRFSTSTAELGNSVDSLETAVSGEASSRGTAVSSLETRIGAEETATSSINSSVNSLETAVTTEATTRATADSALDSSVDSLETAISGEASSRGAADTALQASVDSLETAVSAEATTHSNDTSSLETAISAEATTRASADTALQASVDSIETKLATIQDAGATLDTFQELVSFVESLDDVDGVEIVNLGLSVDSLETAVSGESSSRSTAVSSLNTRIAADEGDMTAVEASVDSLETAISGEASSRGAADTALQASVDSLETAVSGEASSRGAADTALQASVDSLETAVSSEASSRSTSVSSLDTRIAADEGGLTAVEASVNSLETAVSGEASSRSTAVSSLNTRIAADEGDMTAVEASVDSLETAISGEASSRGAADTALQASVDSLETRVGTLTTDLASEESDRAAADTTLQASVDSLETAVSSEASSRSTSVSSLDTRIAADEGDMTAVEASIDSLEAFDTALATSLTTTAITISGSSDTPFAIYNTGDTSPLFMVDASSSWDGAPRVTIRQANDHGQTDTAYPATSNTDGAIRGVFHVEKQMSEGDYDSTTEENMPLISAFAMGDGSQGGSGAVGGSAIVRLVSWGGDSKIQMYAAADAYDSTSIGGKRPLSGQTLGAVEFGGYATNQGPLPAAWMRVVAAETWSYSNTNGTLFQFRSTREGSGNGYSQGGIDTVAQMSHNRGFNVIAPPVAYANTGSMLVLNSNQTNDGWASYMFASDGGNNRMVMYVKDSSGSVQTMNLPYTIGEDVAGLSTSVSEIGSDLTTLSGSVSTNASNISSNSTTIASNEGIIGDIRDAVNAAANGDDLLTRLQAISWPT